MRVTVQVRVERCPSAKAYMRLHTSLGDLNLELHCDIAPRACENFLALAEGGYYAGTAFHRSIRNFMIQACRGSAPCAPCRGLCFQLFCCRRSPHVRRAGSALWALLK